MKKNASYALLKLCVSDSEPVLRELYQKHIDAHNHKMKMNLFQDSGFDVFIPSDVTFLPKDGINSVFVPLQVRAEMSYYTSDGETQPTAFDIYLRSSASKTPLMLANHVGIIDMGYRGPLTGAFRNLSGEAYFVKKHTRLLQICHWSRCPIIVELVAENELTGSERGIGGFGSTDNPST